MLRRSAWQLSAFARLLCGDRIADVMQTKEECENATKSFRTLSSSAPLPLPMAVASAAVKLKLKEPREVAAMIASSHRPAELVGGIADAIRQDALALSNETLKQLAETLRAANAPGEDAVLILLAERSTVGETAHPTVKAEVRQLLLRRIRLHPSSAPVLLRSLCCVSSGTATEVEDVLETMQIAMRGGFVNPADFAPILGLLLQTRNHRRLIGHWAWMRHTSACWDREAASAALCAASELNYLEDAVACIQGLAEAGHDPTAAAQEVFVRFLGTRSPPLPVYAEQLVCHWYPPSSAATNEERNTGPSAALWDGDSQGVGVELLFAHLRSSNHTRVVALLLDACKALTREAETQRLVRQNGMPVLMRHYAKDIAASEDMMRVLFHTVRAMMGATETKVEMRKNSKLLGSFVIVGRHADRMEEVKMALGSVVESGEQPMDSNYFQAMLKWVADEAQRDLPPSHTLDLLHVVASAMFQKVPDELSAWLELAGAP